MHFCLALFDLINVNTNNQILNQIKHKYFMWRLKFFFVFFFFVLVKDGAVRALEKFEKQTFWEHCEDWEVNWCANAVRHYRGEVLDDAV